MCILCMLASEYQSNVLEKEYPRALPPLNLTFFLPAIPLEGDHEVKVIKQLIDNNAYKFLPAKVGEVSLFFFFAEKRKKRKKRKKKKKKKKKKIPLF
jgi:hypothetical protein